MSDQLLALVYYSQVYAQFLTFASSKAILFLS